MGTKAFLAFLAAAIVVAMVAYALDRGIYVGSSLEQRIAQDGSVRWGWYCSYLRAGGISKRFYSLLTSYDSRAKGEADPPACTLFERVR